MAITIEGVGTADSSSPFTPSIAGTVLADDIILILVEQASLTSPEVSPAASGYAHVTGSPVGPDSSATVLSVLWKRAVGGETSATVTGPSNHGMTRTITLRGVKSSGNPWNVTPAVATKTNGTGSTASWSSVTTTAADCLVALCLAGGRDSTQASMGTVSNAALSSITERMDSFTTSGTGGGVGLATGFKATAGAVGTSSATMSSTDGLALLTLALEPAPTITVITADADVTATGSIAAAALVIRPAAATVAAMTSIAAAADIAVGPPYLDASSPTPLWSTSDPAVSDSFTPPDGSVIYALCIGDSNNTFAVSGGGLTWSVVGTASGANGSLAVVRAQVGTSPGSMQVTSDKSGPFTANGLTVLVFTQSEGTFTGDKSANNTTTGTDTITTTADATWVWAVMIDENQLPNNPTTDCEFYAVQSFGGIGGAVLRTTALTPTSGTNVLIGDATSGAPAIFAFEVKPPAGAATITAAAAITAAGTISATGLVVRPAASTIPATGSLTAAGIRTPIAGSSVTAAGSITASALVVALGAAAVTAAGAVSAAGTVVTTAPVFTANATISATGTTTAASLVVALAAAAVTATGSVTAAAVRTPVGAATSSAATSITAAALVIATATATIPAAGQVTANPVIAGQQIGNATTSAAGTIAAAALLIRVAAATVPASGQIAAAAVQVQRATATTAASGAITATAGVVQAAAAILTAATLVAADARVVPPLPEVGSWDTAGRALATHETAGGGSGIHEAAGELVATHEGA